MEKTIMTIPEQQQAIFLIDFLGRKRAIDHAQYALEKMAVKEVTKRFWKKVLDLINNSVL
jgi:hypothetical protein